MTDNDLDDSPVGARLLPAIDLRLWFLLVTGTVAVTALLILVTLVFGSH